MGQAIENDVKTIPTPLSSSKHKGRHSIMLTHTTLIYSILATSTKRVFLKNTSSEAITDTYVLKYHF